MRIINAHVHMVEVAGALAQGDDEIIPGGIAVYSHLRKTLPLLDKGVLLSQMDEAGVETSVLYSVLAPIVFSSNEYVSRLCHEHPDRLIGFGCVNPLAEGAAKELERIVTDLGLRGLKLHPPLQNFYPNDERTFDVYAKCVELNLPVVFHVGTTPFGAKCRLDQADPLLIDEVACAFPELRIMLTHLGTLWHNEAFMVVEKHPNVYIDTAAYLYEIPQLMTRDLVNRLGAEKFIFGTDYPSPFGAEQHRMRDFVDCVGGLDLDHDVIENIFFDNFQRLLIGAGEKTAGLNAEDVPKELAELLAGHKGAR